VHIGNIKGNNLLELSISTNSPIIPHEFSIPLFSIYNTQ